MVDANETKRYKARQLCRQKSLVKDLNLETIKEDLYDIIRECDDVTWYMDSDDDTLLNAWGGDEEEELEFKIMFSNLCADCERMQEDLKDIYIPECFNDLFVGIGAGSYGGGLLAWDDYEQDYYGLGFTDELAENVSIKRLMRLTKKELIESAQACFKIVYSYMGIRYRYDCLKSALDILRDENTGYLQMVKKIEELYEKAAEEDFWVGGENTRELERLASTLPAEVWLQ